MTGTVATVFAIVELVGVGLDYAERIGILLKANEQEMAEIREQADRRRRAAMDKMNSTQ